MTIFLRGKTLQIHHAPTREEDLVHQAPRLLSVFEGSWLMVHPHPEAVLQGLLDLLSVAHFRLKTLFSDLEQLSVDHKGRFGENRTLIAWQMCQFVLQHVFHIDQRDLAVLVYRPLEHQETYLSWIMILPVKSDIDCSLHLLRRQSLLSQGGSQMQKSLFAPSAEHNSVKAPTENLMYKY